jgi:hypothetical protein
MQLSDDVRRFLEGAPLAALCLPLDLGRGQEAVLVVKGTLDLLEGLRAAAAPVDVGWVLEPTARGPVLCLVVRSGAAGVGDLLAEVYFDVADPGDALLLERLAGQAGLRVAFLDEDLGVAWAPELAWDEVRALEADQMRDRAEELRERTEAYDFDAAKELFQEALGLEGLEARAFPS